MKFTDENTSSVYGIQAHTFQTRIRSQCLYAFFSSCLFCCCFCCCAAAYTRFIQFAIFVIINLIRYKWYKRKSLLQDTVCCSMFTMRNFQYAICIL